MCHFHSFSTKTTSGERKYITVSNYTLMMWKCIIFAGLAFESLEWTASVTQCMQDSLCAHKLCVEADGGLGQSCRSLDLLTKRLKTTHDGLCISWFFFFYRNATTTLLLYHHHYSKVEASKWVRWRSRRSPERLVDACSHSDGGLVPDISLAMCQPLLPC